jgi:hypothetical protein
VKTSEGKTLLPMGGGLSGSQARIEFAALPAGSKQMTLEVGMNGADPACKAPSEWSIDLPLGAMPANATIMPVVEETRPEDAAASQPTPSTPVTSDVSTDQLADFKFVIDKSVELGDGYLISGHIQSNTLSLNDMSNIPGEITATDADGKSYPIELSDEGTKDNQMAYKVTGKSVKSPLTITIRSVTVFANFEEGPSFNFDTGSELKLGQSWDIHQDLSVFGRKISIDKVTAVHSDKDTQKADEVDGFELDATVDPEIQNFSIFPKVDRTNGMGWAESGGEKVEGNVRKADVYFEKGIPTGNLTLRLTMIQMNLNGSWETQWQVPDTGK